MTKMQRQVNPDCPILPSGDSFDMWQDYMNLGGLLARLCAVREADRGDAEGPQQREPGAAPWTCLHAPPRGKRSRSSAGTSSASSPSDNSSNGTSSDYCRFCKQNGECPSVYRSHRLKAHDGRVVCPILRKYTCPICGVSGDYAHTRRYCPQARQQEAARMPPGSKSWQMFGH